MSDQELEVKFYITKPANFIHRMVQLKAVKHLDRTNEWNLRFDSASGDLSSSGKALRLRQDGGVRLTYKGPSQGRMDITAREELEVELSDLATSRKILEALGFQVVAVYEKFRTTWKLDDVEVVLDELPMGVFCEIEGPDAESIKSAADKLGLYWDHRIFNSYLGIFNQLKNANNWKAANLTFADMHGVKVNKQILDKISIFPADE